MGAASRHCGQCGRPKQYRLEEVLEEAHVSPLLRRFVRLLARHPGNYVPYETIIAAIYADDLDGAPNDPKAVLKTRLSQGRRALAEAGLHIECLHSVGMRLRFLDTPGNEPPLAAMLFHTYALMRRAAGEVRA